MGTLADFDFSDRRSWHHDDLLLDNAETLASLYRTQKESPSSQNREAGDRAVVALEAALYDGEPHQTATLARALVSACDPGVVRERDPAGPLADSARETLWQVAGWEAATRMEVVARVPALMSVLPSAVGARLMAEVPARHRHRLMAGLAAPPDVTAEVGDILARAPTPDAAARETREVLVVEAGATDRVLALLDLAAHRDDPLGADLLAWALEWGPIADQGTVPLYHAASQAAWQAIRRALHDRWHSHFSPDAPADQRAAVLAALDANVEWHRQSGALWGLEHGVRLVPEPPAPSR